MQIASIANTSSQAQSSADLLAQSIHYSASIGGKTYDASIQSSAGEYVATIPNLPNITASGSSLLLAETNLDAKISLIA
jgi:hypothetical protein